MNTQRITLHQVIESVRKIINTEDECLSFSLDNKKHSLYGYQKFEKVFELKLPLPFPSINDDEKIENYVGRVDYAFSPYIIMLIQAGSCALGYFENGKVLKSKVIKTYMVRKGQGKNQLTFLNNGRKGTSAGSQLRYQNAIRFFEEINDKLNEWNKITKPKRIFYSCPIKMWHYIFNSKVKCCFDKKDPRLHKIPLDVNVPNFEEMMRINKHISFGYLTFYKQNFDEMLLFA